MEQIDFTSLINHAFLMDSTLIFFSQQIYVLDMTEQSIFGSTLNMLIIVQLCLDMEVDNVELAIFKLLII